MTKVRIINILLLPLILSCVPSVYLRSTQDAETRLNEAGLIFVSKSNEMSVEEKNFYATLTEELQKSHINMAKNESSADYVLTYGVVETAIVGQSWTTEPETVTHFGYVGRHRAIWHSHGFRTVPYTYVYPAKEILIKLFLREEFVKGKRVPIWEGLISADKQLYRERMRDIVNVLVRHFGEDYDGRIGL
jgi:hypothetical protein